MDVAIINTIPQQGYPGVMTFGHSEWAGLPDVCIQGFTA